MNKAPSYQRYPDKWLAGTKRLSWSAKGIYADLLETIWLHFQDTCSIPYDSDFICSELRCEKEVFEASIKEILNPYMPLLQVTETNRLFSRGLWKEAEKQRKRRDVLIENGKKGGRPIGSKNQKDIFRKPKRNQNESTPTTTPTTSTITTTYKKYAKGFAPLFLERMGKANGIKIIAKPPATETAIVKLLMSGVTEAELEATTDWLEFENPKRGKYRIVVQSGSALLNKWDKIQAAMFRDNGGSDVDDYTRYAL